MTKGHYRRHYNALQFPTRQEKTASTASPRGAWRRVRREAGGPSGHFPWRRVRRAGLGLRVWGYGGGYGGALGNWRSRAAGVHQRAEAPLQHPDGAAGQGAPTARRSGRSRVSPPTGMVPVSALSHPRRWRSRARPRFAPSALRRSPRFAGCAGQRSAFFCLRVACARSGLRRSPRCAGLCRPEVGVSLPARRLCSVRIAPLAPLRGAGPPPPGELAGGRRFFACVLLRLVALRRSPRCAGRCRPEVGVPLPACCSAWWHCAARPAARGGAGRRSALSCLRLAPPGGMGARRQFSVLVAPSATRRALPRLRNAG